MNEPVGVQRALEDLADADFQRLRRRFVEGRITLAELEEQVGKVYTARVRRGPEGLVSDRGPAVGARVRDLSSVPSSGLRVAEARPQVVTYLLVMALLVGIWATTGMGYFWPVWPMMGWGIGIAGRALGMSTGCGPHRAYRGQHARLYHERQEQL